MHSQSPHRQEEDPEVVRLRAEVANLRRAVEELSVLNDAATAVGQAADLDTAIEALVHRALDALGADEGVIVLVNDALTQGDTSPATFVRSVATHTDHETHHPSVSLLGWVQTHQRPLIVDDPASDERFVGTDWPDGVRTVVSVPMFAEGCVSGVFTVYNKREGTFSNADARLLTILAAQSAQVVERMRLREESERALRLFGQHTAPEVVAALMAGGGEVPIRRQDVTVMFLDLRGFTTMAEAWAPEAVVDYLNCFFDEAIGAVVAHGGVVHQLLGDGLMALFGVPTPDPEAPRHAVAAAHDIVERVCEACASGRLSETRLGIGLHTGEAVVGPVGSADHREYKVTGDVVNVTARIESLNKVYDSQILASEAVVRRAGLEEGLVTPLGDVALSGRLASVSLYRLR